MLSKYFTLFAALAAFVPAFAAPLPGDPLADVVVGKHRLCDVIHLFILFLL